MDGMNMSPSSTHDYSAKGMIEKIASDKKTVSIQNEDIPGYMKSMTMDYVVQKPTELSGIKVGDKITFTLEAADSGLLAKDIKKSN
jgi:Cu/Ag efflux protein CusF